MAEPLFTTVMGPDGYPIPVMRTPDLVEAVQQAPRNLAAGVVSNLVPAPGYEAKPSLLGTADINAALHSGAALRAYEFAAGLPTAAANLLRQAGTSPEVVPGTVPPPLAEATTPLPTTAIHYPGQAAVEQQLEAIKEQSRSILHVQKPTTAGGEMASEVAYGGGTWLTPLPKLAGASKLATHVADILAPPLSTGVKIAPVMGGFTGVMEAASYASNPQQYEAFVAQQAQLGHRPEQTAAAATQPQPTDVAPIAQPTPGTQGPAETPPAPVTGVTAPPSADVSLLDRFVPQETAVAPTAPSEGPSTALLDRFIPAEEVRPTPQRGRGGEQDRAQAIHDEFVRIGYPEHVAWGMASNALHESGGDYATRPGDKGASHGLFQWQGPRIRNYVARYGHLPKDGSVREAVDFIDWELRNTEKGRAPAIFNTRNSAEAAAVISRDFIRPAAVQENMNNRARTATRIEAGGVAGPGRVQYADAGNIRTDATAAPAVDTSLLDRFVGGATPTTQAPASAIVAPEQQIQKPSVFAPDYSQSQGETGVSLGTVALGALGVIGGIALHRPLTRGVVGVADRMGLTAARDAEIAAANTRVTERGTAAGGAAPVGDVPLPARDTSVARLIPKAGVGIDNALTRVSANWRNSDIPLLRLEEAIKDTKWADPTIEAKLNLRNDMPVHTAIREQASNGTSFLTGRSIPKFEDMLRKVENLSEADRGLAEKAIEYENEAQRRNLRAAKGLDPAFDFPGVPTLGYVDTATGKYVEGLSDVVKQARAVPAINDIMNLRSMIRKATLEDAVQTNRITAAEMAQELKERPGFLSPLDKTGATMPAFSKEPILDKAQVGSPTRRGSVWSADAQEYTNAYREMARHVVESDHVQRYFKASEANPKLPKAFSESKNANGEWVKPAGPHTTVYTKDGPQHYNVHNPLVARALQGPQPINNAALGVIAQFANTSRRLVQNTSTGLAAATLGKLYPLVGNAYNAALMPVTRDPKMIGSFLDLAARRAGLKRGINLPDPLQFAGSYAMGGVDAGSEFNRWLANKLHPESGSPFNKRMRAMLGDAGVDAIHGRMQSLWDNSIRARMRADRIGGTSRGSMDAQSFMTTSPGKVFSPIFGMSPKLFPSRIAERTARISPLGGRMVQTLVDTKGLAQEMFSALNEGAHSMQYRLNVGRVGKDLTREELASHIRRSTGDPGVSGGGATSRALATSIPYYNVSAQSLDRFIQAIREHPIAVSTSAAATMTMGALAEQYTAMLHGEDTVNHLANGIATNQRSNSLNFYHSGDPSHRTEVPVSYEYRPFLSFFKELVAHATNALSSGKPGEPTYERLLNALHDIAGKHVSQSTFTSMIHGTGDLLNMIQVPGPVQAGVAAATGGKTIDTRLDRIALNVMSGQSWLHGMLHSGSFDPRSPNDPDPNNQVTDNDAAALKAVIHSIVGVGAEAMQAMAGAADRYKSSEGDMGFALHDFFDNMRQSFKDRNPMVGGMFGNSSKLSPITPLVERVSREVNEIKGMRDVVEQEQAAGLTRKMGRPVDVTPGQAHAPTDPIMRSMAIDSAEAYKFIQKNYLPQIQDIEKQIAKVQHGDLPAESKRKVVNDLTAEAYGWYQKIDDRLEALNQAHSTIAGVKVPRGHIDYSGGVDQFKR